MMCGPSEGRTSVGRLLFQSHTAVRRHAHCAKQLKDAAVKRN